MTVPEGFDPASGRVDGFAWAAEQWETDSVAQDAALDAALAFEPVGTAAERIMAARAGRRVPVVVMEDEALSLVGVAR